MANFPLRTLRLLLTIAVPTGAVLTSGCAAENTVGTPAALTEAAPPPAQHRLVVLRPVMVTDENGNTQLVHKREVVMLTPVMEGEKFPGEH